jgi:hypothetical protein
MYTQLVLVAFRGGFWGLINRVARSLKLQHDCDNLTMLS